MPPARPAESCLADARERAPWLVFAGSSSFRNVQCSPWICDSRPVCTVRAELATSSNPSMLLSCYIGNVGEVLVLGGRSAATSLSADLGRAETRLVSLMYEPCGRVICRADLPKRRRYSYLYKGRQVVQHALHRAGRLLAGG